MRFACLGSGSSGNATIVQSGNTTLMLDCGFACKETVKRLEKIDLSPEQINAIVISHEHSDHMSGAKVFSRRFNTPIWLNQGTLQQRKLDVSAPVHLFNSFEAFQIGDIQLHPCLVPHDARETVQFVFQSNQKRLGMLTDLGHISLAVQQTMQHLDALILEANHDPDMLMQGSYRPSLKQRVAGEYGHLSNHQALSFVHSLAYEKLQHLVLAHLSRENNTKQKVAQSFMQISQQLQQRFSIAHHQHGFDWKEIN